MQIDQAHAVVAMDGHGADVGNAALSELKLEGTNSTTDMAVGTNGHIAIRFEHLHPFDICTVARRGHA